VNITQNSNLPFCSYSYSFHIQNEYSFTGITHFRSRILEEKVARLVKWISGHVCELLLTSFLNGNSSNLAVFLFVQTPFDAAKQSVFGRTLPSFVGVVG